MQISLELFVWSKGSVTRNFVLPAPREFLAARGLRRLARRPDVQELLARSELPVDFLDSHIDAFIDGLRGDCDYAHNVSKPLLGGMADDVRVCIRSKSTASCKRESAWVQHLFATLPPPVMPKVVVDKHGQLKEVLDDAA